MPLPIPVLNDRRFDDLVTEARALIPTSAPEWTNHNASDPGITLVELFAYITETLLYRLDRVTPEIVCAFLNLLDGDSFRAPIAPGSQTITVRALKDDSNGTRVLGPVVRETGLASEIRTTVLALRKLDRAVTCEDFETLALDPAALTANHGGVARVKCIAQRNLARDAKADEDQSDHVSVIVLPGDTYTSELGGLITDITTYLESRRLLGTRLHVVEPSYATVGVQVQVVPRADQLSFSDIQKAVVGTVTNFLSPYPGGGPAGTGWPFGRDVFVSELYAVISRLPQISYVEAVTLTADASRRRPKEPDPLIGVTIHPHELVTLSMTTNDVTQPAKPVNPSPDASRKK